MLKNKKGVTFVELMIAVITIIVLSVVSYKMYGYQIEKSVAVDGAQLLRKIVDSEMTYRLENRVWTSSFDDLDLKIDAVPVSGSESTVKTKDFVFSLGVDRTTLEITALRYYTEKDFDSGKYGYSMIFKMDSNTSGSEDDNDSYAIGFDANSIGGTRVEGSVVNYLRKRFGR